MSKRGKSRNAGTHGGHPRRRRGLLGRLARGSAIALIWAGVAGGAALAWFAYGLPDIHASVVAAQPALHLRAADGTPLATLGGSHAAPVGLEALPRALLDAVIATEDRRFWEHSGIDLRSIGRAAFTNLRAGAIRQGGSTITQQLAKNLFLTHERSWTRKAREALLALWLERALSKEEILTLYLNRVYLGAGTYGVEAAARRYFGKSARSVSLAEAAMLAGLLKAPSRYAPSADPEGAWARARTVLDAMVAAGAITPAARRAARTDRPVLVPRAEGSSRGRYFADWVMAQVPDFAGPAVADLEIATTLDPTMQAAAARAVEEALARSGARFRVSQAALVALDRDGAVRAMVGGRDFGRSPFNRAANARRQPGSAFKLFVYLAGLEAGLSPESVMRDEPVDVGGWRPGNYDAGFVGAVTLREAFARSINTVAVRVSEHVGRAKVRDAAIRLGVTSPMAAHPSIALGAVDVTLLELTTAYAVLANGGRGVFAYGIREIRDRAGARLYRRQGAGPGQVVAAPRARALTDLLRAVVAEGTGKAAALGRPAAGKTGTSGDHRDAWFIGFTADLTAGVWVGNDDGSPTRGVTGGGLPAEIWRRFMTAAHEGL